VNSVFIGKNLKLEVCFSLFDCLFNENLSLFFTVHSHFLAMYHNK
jgi:hypothetical protein